MRLLPARACTTGPHRPVRRARSSAQSAQSVSSASVPRLINISGVFRPAERAAGRRRRDGHPGDLRRAGGRRAAVAGDADRRTRWPGPLRAAARRRPRRTGSRLRCLGRRGQWLGTVFERAGEVEGPRVRITSVPYALRAADADTLGGRPASAYLLAPRGARRRHRRHAQAAANARRGPDATADVVLPGTPNFLAKYVNGADVGNSACSRPPTARSASARRRRSTRSTSASTTPPATSPASPSRTSAIPPLAYSGMLFYDHNGALGQFQGFNNSTHEYRINNIARVSPGGAFNGSINFMIGGTSRFFVDTSGVGIGTTAPLGRTSR